MDYQNLINKLEQSNEPLSTEAAKAIKELLADNKNLRESYDAMFRDLQRAYDKLKR